MELGSPINCVTFNLQRAARRAGRLLDDALAPWALTAQQFGTLAHLDGMGPLSTTALARLLGADRTTVTRNADVLERRGLVAPVLQEDARLRALALTDAGKAALAAARPAWACVQERLVGSLGATGAGGLLASLRRLE